MYQLIVVDDETELREGISNYFPWESIGIEVAGIFENGNAALAYIRTNPVDIVLTDVRMPVMGGLELIEKAAPAYPFIRFVILSGYRDFDYAKKGMLLGVRDYIVKPTKYSQILEVFTRITAELDHRAQERSLERVSPPSTEKALISNIKKYIRTHYAEATLENVAGYVHLSPYYLSTFFKKQTDEKFYDYVFRIRMEMAEKLLLHGDQTIYEIGEAVGYTNPNSFTHAFKQYFGCNPKDYRRLKEQE